MFNCISAYPLCLFWRLPHMMRNINVLNNCACLGKLFEWTKKMSTSSSTTSFLWFGYTYKAIQRVSLNESAPVSTSRVKTLILDAEKRWLVTEVLLFNLTHERFECYILLHIKISKNTLHKAIKSDHFRRRETSAVCPLLTKYNAN